MGIFEIGAVVAVVLGLVEISKWLIEFILKRANPEILAEKQRQSKMENQIQTLYDLHNIRDKDGTPVWYVPRSWMDTQEKVLETCQAIANGQEKLADTLERAATILDRIDQRSRG